MTTTHKLKLSSPLRPIWNRKIRIIRTIVQLVMFGLFNGLIFGLSRVAIAIPVAFPTGGPFSTTWNAFEALQYMITFMVFPYLILSIFALFGSILGKTTCGWACPFGLFQDLFRYLPFKKKKVSKPTNKSLSSISTTIVVFVVIFAFIIGTTYARTGNKNSFGGAGKDFPYSTIDPASTLFATLYYYLKWGISNDPLGDQITSWRFLFIVRILIFIAVLVLIALYPRAYCRWLCPTGAILGFFSKYSLFGIRRNPNRCLSGCNKCEQACPMQVPILSYEKDVTDKMCINCLECVEACEEGALKFTFRLLG